VRYNTLMVLTHLILNDMVKVKGQVCHVVLCILDNDSRVADLARVFFNELSKRSNNPIYNLMGDIVAILSRDESDINPETETDSKLAVRLLSSSEFQLVMSFLLTFIKADKDKYVLQYFARLMLILLFKY
jgi:condensin complex subunit 1